MNFYKQAIINNEVSDFFRGKQKYYSPDRERKDKHDNSFTTYEIFGYSAEIGELELFKQLESDLVLFLNISDFSEKDLLIVLNVFWLYFTFKTENKLANELKIDSQLLKLIYSKMNQKSELNTQLIIDILKRMKERFGFELV